MIIIRTATWADLDAVASLERVLFDRDAWSPQSVEQEFEALSNQHRALVADSSPDVIGYGVVSYAGDRGEVRRIAVAPAHQRQGVAARLLAELLGVAREGGCERILLEVAADNEAALTLYARLGFSEISRRPKYYAGGADALVMQAELDADAHSATARRLSPAGDVAGDSRRGPDEGRP